MLSLHICAYGTLFIIWTCIYVFTIHSFSGCLTYSSFLQGVADKPAFPDAAGNTAMTVFTNKFPQLLLRDAELIPHGEHTNSPEKVSPPNQKV